jgi:hypothetical protein
LQFSRVSTASPLSSSSNMMRMFQPVGEAPTGSNIACSSGHTDRALDQAGALLVEHAVDVLAERRGLVQQDREDLGRPFGTKARLEIGFAEATGSENPKSYRK